MARKNDNLKKKIIYGAIAAMLVFASGTAAYALTRSSNKEPSTETVTTVSATDTGVDDEDIITGSETDKVKDNDKKSDEKKDQVAKKTTETSKDTTKDGKTTEKKTDSKNNSDKNSSKDQKENSTEKKTSESAKNGSEKNSSSTTQSTFTVQEKSSEATTQNSNTGNQTVTTSTTTTPVVTTETPKETTEQPKTSTEEKKTTSSATEKKSTTEKSTTEKPATEAPHQHNWETYTRDVWINLGTHQSVYVTNNLAVRVYSDEEKIGNIAWDDNLTASGGYHAAQIYDYHGYRVISYMYCAGCDRYAYGPGDDDVESGDFRVVDGTEWTFICDGLVADLGKKREDTDGYSGYPIDF